MCKFSENIFMEFFIAYLKCKFQYARMIKRHIYKKVRKALTRQAAIALIGPRQVGKTTLALDIAENQDTVILILKQA